MKEPKTIKGYLSLIRQLEGIDPAGMKGYDKLPVEEQKEISRFWAGISNFINEFEDERNSR